ncbi:MAG: hypothetical protein LBS64_02955 [Spirochaetaceae bacterium]|jgi:hypothetical protein|nr:hypothetical protein [Spirochaetaceae bacterium]
MTVPPRFALLLCLAAPLLPAQEASPALPLLSAPIVPYSLHASVDSSFTVTLPGLNWVYLGDEAAAPDAGDAPSDAYSTDQDTTRTENAVAYASRVQAGTGRGRDSFRTVFTFKANTPARALVRFYRRDILTSGDQEALWDITVDGDSP